MADAKKINLPIRKPVDIRTLLGAKYNASDLSNLDKFIENIAQIESVRWKKTIYTQHQEGKGN